MDKPMTELRSVTCHMGSHSVTCHRHRWARPALTPAMQAGTRFTYPGGMEGWVDLVTWYAQPPGVELATSRSRIQRPNHWATKQHSQSFAVGKTEANLWLLWEGTRLPFTAWQWSAHSRPSRTSTLSKKMKQNKAVWNGIVSVLV